MLLRVIKFLKDAGLAFPITMLFQPIAKYLAFIYYYNMLIKWVHKHKGKVALSDFYLPKRDYEKRYALYDYLVTNFGLQEQALHYLEFGVASGASIKWWVAHTSSTQAAYFGFDTFEGLPEKWGTYDKGDMASSIPKMDDTRVKFFKGLFQDTLNPFIQENQAILHSSTRKIIHMDADLYSATAFVLAQLYPYIHKGDIIMFDEFSVPMHEFKAYHEFTTNFYVSLKPIAAVNNFYQTAFIVE